MIYPLHVDVLFKDFLDWERHCIGVFFFRLDLSSYHCYMVFWVGDPGFKRKPDI